MADAGAGHAPPARLPLGVKLGYAAPTLATAGMAVPIFIYMNKFYADVVQLPLGMLAIAIAVARAFDAITDPLVGWLSDRTRTRFGRRRPWLAVGAPLAACSYLVLFSPPSGLTNQEAGLWFGASFLLYFVFQTAFAIPHNALGPELSLDYHERSNLFGWRESFVLAGTIVGALLPGLLEGVLGAPRPAYAGMAAIFAVLLVALSLPMLASVRERPEFSARRPNPLVPGVRRALRNRPFRILLASYVAASVTAAIPGTLLPFFIAYVVRPEREVLWITAGVVAHFAAALISIGPWVAASHRFGKKPAWLLAIALGIVSLGLAFFVREGQVVAGVGLFVGAGVAFGGQIFLTPSIQADVIDYDELHTGRRREAQYGALWALLPKLIAIPGAAIPLSVLGALGYRPGAPQSPEVVLAIRVLFALVPCIFSTISLVIAAFFPIDEARHRAIRDGIASHARGQAASDPLTGQRLEPPGRREVDEELGWLLDHLSASELRRSLRHGRGRAVFDVALSGVVTLLAGAGAVAVALARAGDLSGSIGPLPVVAVVVAGIAFSLAIFHALRLAPALRLWRTPPAPGVLEAQLRAIEAQAGRSRGGPAAA